MALAPLIGDLLVVPLALVLVGSLSSGVVRGLSYAGAAFLVWLAVDTIRKAYRPEATDGRSALSDLWRGAVVNVLNPHPWLFWFTVGGPLLIAYWTEQPSRALGFLAGFYVLLIGSKLTLALLAGRGRRWLTGPWHRRLVVASGIVLISVAFSIVIFPPL